MNSIWRRPVAVRVLPFAAFMLLLALRGAAGDAVGGVDTRWLYGVQVVVVTALLAWGWRDYGELAAQLRPTQREALASVLLGLLVFVVWIAADAPWMILGTASAPFDGRAAASPPDAMLIVVRAAGAVLVVPLMEELFWRSFLMRWVDDAQFERVAPHTVTAKAVVLSTFVFVLAHTQWLAAALAGLVYALLYRQRGKLWLAVIAHAVTNAALAVYVVSRGQWQFW